MGLSISTTVFQGKRAMQMPQAAAKAWTRPCARCGKPTFTDLLDREGLCDYCREVQSMKSSVIRNSKKRRKCK